jgi:hypothetical protein
MPRRTKVHIEPYKTLVNGGRAEVEKFEGDEYYDPVLDPISTAEIASRVATHVGRFAELGQIPYRAQLIRDLSYECGSAKTLRLDNLLRGTRMKPDEWRVQILARGVARVLEVHGIKPAVSEYEQDLRLKRSIYLRILRGLIKVAGLRRPKKDIKGLALRARRIGISS